MSQDDPMCLGLTPWLLPEDVGSAHSKPCPEGQDWKERRKTKCWTWNQRALNVFKLLARVGNWLSDFPLANQDSLSHSQAQFSSISIRNYPVECKYWGKEGWEYARTISHSPASKLLIWNRRVKLSSSGFNA